MRNKKKCELSKVVFNKALKMKNAHDITISFCINRQRI